MGSKGNVMYTITANVWVFPKARIFCIIPQKKSVTRTAVHPEAIGTALRYIKKAPLWSLFIFMDFTVYILFSERFNKHYTGFTSNLPQRLKS